MLSKHYSAAIYGTQAIPIEVEVDSRNGLPGQTIVGLPDAAVRESRERVMSALKNSGYGSSDKPYPVITGQDCDKPNVKAMINDQQSMSVFKDTRTLASKVVEMVDAILQGKVAPVNDTKTYNNGIKVIPSFLCEPIYADKGSYKKLLVDSGYYKEADLK